jgi:hypothetical protein
MKWQIAEYQDQIDILYNRLIFLEIQEVVPEIELKNLETEVLNTLKKIVSWYGVVSISTFGNLASSRAAKLILICNSDVRFQTLYFHLMIQNRRNFTQSDISALARKLGLKLEGKQQ